MWDDFDFNPGYDGEEITEINGVRLPENYIEFMKLHNGGEGDIGEDAGWLVLYPMEELREVNNDEYIRECLPEGIIIGSNGAEELYGIDIHGNYFNVPSLIEEEYLTVICDDISDFAERLNEFWRNM